MIQVIAEHSVDTSLLKEKSKILDLGCRGFEFTRHFLKEGHTVFPVDIDHLEGTMSYFKCAIGGENKRVGVNKKENDPQATAIKEGDDIQMFTIELFTDLLNDQRKAEIKYWDVIKMDIEGAEIDALMAMTKPMGKQLSIEFHLHTGIYNIYDVRKVEQHLAKLKYTPVSHEMSDRHGSGMNYWDSLWIFNL